MSPRLEPELALEGVDDGLDVRPACPIGHDERIWRQRRGLQPPRLPHGHRARRWPGPGTSDLSVPHRPYPRARRPGRSPTPPAGPRRSPGRSRNHGPPWPPSCYRPRYRVAPLPRSAGRPSVLGAAADRSRASSAWSRDPTRPTPVDEFDPVEAHHRLHQGVVVAIAASSSSPCGRRVEAAWRGVVSGLGDLQHLADQLGSVLVFAHVHLARRPSSSAAKKADALLDPVVQRFGPRSSTGENWRATRVTTPKLSSLSSLSTVASRAIRTDPLCSSAGYHEDATGGGRTAGHGDALARPAPAVPHDPYRSRLPRCPTRARHEFRTLLPLMRQWPSGHQAASLTGLPSRPSTKLAS